MANNRRYNKKYVTRNIFPDILKLLKMCIILLLIYIGACMLYDGVMPFVGGYSVYKCNIDYIEFGYKRGELLILKDGIVEGKDVVLVEDRGTDFRLEKSSSEGNLGTVVGSIDIVESLKSIYNDILGVFKHK